MACSLALYIKNKEGEDTESILFDKLYKATNSRSEAAKLYNAINSNEFKNSQIWSNLEFDVNGEPTFDSLYKNGLSEFLDDSEIISSLKKEIGAVDSKGKPVSYVKDVVGLSELCNKVNKFNSENHNGFIAVVKTGRNDNNQEVAYIDIYNGNTSYVRTEMQKYKSNLMSEALNMFDSPLISSKEIMNTFANRLLDSVGESYNLKLFADIEDYDPTKVLNVTMSTLSHFCGAGEYVGMIKYDNLSDSDKELYCELLAESICSNSLIKEGEDDVNKFLTRGYGKKYVYGAESVVGTANMSDEEKLKKAKEILVKKILLEGTTGDKLVDAMINNNMINQVRNNVFEMFGNMDANGGTNKLFQILNEDKFNVQSAKEKSKRLEEEENKKYTTNNPIIRKAYTEATDKIKQLEEYSNRLETLFQDILNAEYRRRGILKEKKGLTEAQERFFSEDLKDTESIINKLSSARKAQRISTAIYEYIQDIGNRIDHYTELIRNMNNESYSIKQKASVYRDVTDFIKLYQDLSISIRDLMLDGGNFIEEIKDKSFDDLVKLMTYEGLKADKVPSEIKKFVSEFSSMTPSQKMEKLEEAKEVANKFIEWQVNEGAFSNWDLQDKNEEKTNMINDLEATMNVLESVKQGSLWDRQQSITRSLEAYDSCVQNIRSKMNIAIKPMIAKFLESYMSENQKTLKYGEYMGFKKEIDIEKLLTEVTEDISMFQRWLSSLTDCSDMILNLMAESIKKAKYTAQRKCQEDMDEIKREALLLEKAGIKDTDWLFETDDNGNRTGFYVQSEYDKFVFDKMMRDASLCHTLGLVEGETFIRFSHPGKKITVNGKEVELDDYFEEIYANRLEYSRKNNTKIVENSQYLEIMKNPAKKRFYEFFMKKYESLQSKYPPRSVQRARMIGIKMNEKETWDKTKGIVERAKMEFEQFKDNFRETVNDEYATMRVDPAGQEIKMLPIYFCNFKDADIPKMSFDCVGALMAYSMKAHEYNELNEVVDSLELTKNLLKERRIEQKNGSRYVVESLKRAKTAIAKGKKVDILKKEDMGTSNVSQMLDDIFDMQLYGRKRSKSGVISIFGHDISVDKTIDWLNKRTAESALSLSILNGVSNIWTGTVMNTIEKASNRYFDEKLWGWADLEYFKNMPDILTQHVAKSRVKTNKLLLMSELYDVQSEAKLNATESDWARNTFKRMYGDMLQCFQNSGEHLMSHRTALAVWKNYKLKDKDGNEISLYDAYEVKYIDKDGNLVDSDQGLGAKVVLKEGVTKKDGSKFTEDDVYRVHAKIIGINHGMHGVYNEEDANAIQRYALGRAAYLFRKWLPAAIQKRAGKLHFDMDQDEWKEGYYRTCGRFIGQLCTDVIKGNKKVKEVWKALEPEEQDNIKRGLLEVSAFVLLWFATHCIGALANGNGDDDKDTWKDTWLWKFIKYQIWRLYSEIGALTPTPAIIPEAIRIFKSPMAGVNTLDQITNVYKSLNPYAWGLFDEEGDDSHIVKRGAFKGYTEGFKSLFGNRAVFPTANSIIRAVSGVEEATAMYMK